MVYAYDFRSCCSNCLVVARIGAVHSVVFGGFSPDALKRSEF